jgi:hypothetical protein
LIDDPNYIPCTIELPLATSDGIKSKLLAFAYGTEESKEGDSIAAVWANGAQ